jgi:hypothetical protein
MTRHMFLALAVLVPSMVLASGERAGADLITFEVVPGVTALGTFFDGTPVPVEARLSNQLQLSEGVSFSSTPGYVALVNLGVGHATSGVSGIGGVNAADALRYNSPVIITFTLPGEAGTPAVTDFVSIRGDNFPVAGGSATMEAFDVNGVLLGSVTVADEAGLTLSLSIPNIHSVRLTQTRSDIAYDDLRFNALSHVGHAPTANAGADQSIHAGRLVTLDGSGSFDDNTATENLVFTWTLTSRPGGSAATLSGDDTARPSFVADVPGVYAATLTVTDGDGLSSAPDTVVVSSLNGAPVADAGPDQGTFVGDAVSLNASMSHDPDLDTLEYSWTLATPVGSGAVLAGETTAFPTFTPDVPGRYLATLTVNDPFGGVATDSLVVSVVTGAQFAENQAVIALNVVGALAPEQVTTRGNRNALQQFLTEVITALQAGDFDEARKKLTNAIQRTDGCALQNTPDGNGQGRDWVTDCAAQASLYPLLTTALDALTR